MAPTPPMPTSRQQLPAWMFEAAGGGIQLSGDTGSGKSTLMEQIARSVASSGEAGLLLIDPPGDLAKKVYRACLKMGKSVLDRTYYVAPGNTKLPIIPLSPLAVDRYEGISQYTLSARLSSKISHAARIVQSSMGGREDFDAMPLLFKWTHRLLKSVAQMGLPMTEVLQFLQVGTDTYHLLTSAVPDLMAQFEFEELAALRVRVAWRSGRPVTPKRRPRSSWMGSLRKWRK
ncbi:MAG: hypothetical protein H8E44_00460 [Planctomycetes bacterium]|nr:hypothetical protein [Planctomycetota bacterium]